MAPRKNKAAPTKKTAARNKSKTTPSAAPANLSGVLAFPYDVGRKTVKDKIIQYLEEEVAKHHETAEKLKEAERRLGGAVEQGAGGDDVDAGLQNMGLDESVQGENEGHGGDGEGDEMELDLEEWHGFGNAPAEGNALADKVHAMEDSIASIAKGLQTMSASVANGFKALAVNNAATGDRSKAARADDDDDDDYDSEGASLLFSGGESDWDELMARYDSAGGKELRKIATGDLVPEKLFLCIPRDSDLFPDIDSEGQEKLRWDDKGPFIETKHSTIYNKIKLLKALHEAVPTPAHFQHAWGWFMTLVNYQYQNAPLMSAMMQFGCEIMQYAGNYDWYDCLRLYCDLTRPILRGGLDKKIHLFKKADFGGKISKCVRLERTRPGPSPAGTASVGAGPAFGRTLPRAQKPNEVCRKFNEGACDAICPFGRKHQCERCEGVGHGIHQCSSSFVPGSRVFANGSSNNNGYRAPQGPSAQQSRFHGPPAGPAFGRQGPRGN